MGVRGPYKLATSGMSSVQAAKWFADNPGKAAPFGDLGPDIKVPKGKMHKHCTRYTWEELQVRGREWYHQGHLTKGVR